MAALSDIDSSWENPARVNSRVSSGNFSLSLIFFFLLPILLLSEEVKDTVHRLPNVEVRAKKTVSNPALSYSANTVIDKKEIQSSSAWQVSDIISRAPGSFIKSYGGLGAMKLASIRGTSSQQVLIMVDGIKLNSSSTGAYDLSLLPSKMIEKVEIVRGGNSSIYGTSAMGGLINIETSFEKENNFGLSFNYGSFSDMQISAESSYNLSDYFIDFFVEHQSSSGDYPFEFSNLGKIDEYKRENANFENSNLFFALSKDISDWKSKFQLIYGNTIRATPGAVLQNNIEDSEAELTEQNIMMGLSTKKQLSGRSRLDFSFSAKNNNFHFENPLALEFGKYGQENNFEASDISFNGSYKFASDFLIQEYIIESAYSHLNGDMLDPETESEVDRVNLAVAVRFEKLFNISDSISLKASLANRLDYYSDIYSTYSPLFGLIFRTKDYSLSSAISYNFRAPSFNEMYYLNYGTNSLKPERALSLNMGLQTEIYDINFNLEGFYIKTKDQIIAKPNSPISWSATNLGEVLTRGFEISADREILKYFRLKLAYTLQKATNEVESSYHKGKIIPYVPQELFGASLMFNTESFSAAIFADYTSLRYFQPDNSYYSMLPSYFTMDFNIQYLFKVLDSGIKLRFEINNILDERYNLILNYPMPGRAFRFGIDYKLN